MVPDGWSEHFLGDVCKISSGVGFPLKFQGRKDLPIPFIKVSDMNSEGNEKYVYSANNTIDNQIQEYIKAPIFPKGCLVLPKVGAALLTNKRRILAQPTAVDNNVMVLMSKSVNYEFLYYWSLLIDMADYVQSGALPSINKSTISQIQITLPPEKEQKKIAAILTSVDDAIQATQGVIDQTRRVKQGLLQQLLTRGIGHTRFKQTEIGEIPEEWEIVDLGEVLEKLQAGVSVNSEDRQREKGELGILKTSCVYDGFFDPTQHKTILKHEMNRASISPLKDHIIISRMNTPTLVGASGYVDRDYPDIYLPDRLWQTAVKDYTKTSARWLSYLLMSPSMRRILSEKATGTSGSMKNLSKNSILDVQIALPPINEQLEIKRILSGIDSSIDHHQEEVKILTSCKNGLMQDLLTGRVRVKPDEVNTT
ncbi:MAG: restriction endonuclease subunit S [Methanosarcinales archaeon]|nr:restriction endonuclease subunit S [Methanosarcinales archaeon]